MRKSILVLALLFPVWAGAANFSARIDLSSTAITSSFAGSHALVSLPGLHRIRTVYVDNRTAVELVVNCSSSTTVVPADSDIGNIWVNASETWALPDEAGFASACYLRLFSGSANSGIFVINITGD